MVLRLPYCSPLNTRPAAPIHVMSREPQNGKNVNDFQLVSMLDVLPLQHYFFSQFMKVNTESHSESWLVKLSRRKLEVNLGKKTEANCICSSCFKTCHILISYVHDERSDL